MARQTFSVMVFDDGFRLVKDNASQDANLGYFKKSDGWTREMVEEAARKLLYA